MCQGNITLNALVIRVFLNRAKLTGPTLDALFMGNVTGQYLGCYDTKMFLLININFSTITFN